MLRAGLWSRSRKEFGTAGVGVGVGKNVPTPILTSISKIPLFKHISHFISTWENGSESESKSDIQEIKESESESGVLNTDSTALVEGAGAFCHHWKNMVIGNCDSSSSHLASLCRVLSLAHKCLVFKYPDCRGVMVMHCGLQDDPVDSNKLFSVNDSWLTRSNGVKLRCKQVQLDWTAPKFFFTNDVVREGNKLPLWHNKRI